jgi:hypothetical protein
MPIELITEQLIKSLQDAGFISCNDDAKYNFIKRAAYEKELGLIKKINDFEYNKNRLEIEEKIQSLKKS